MKIKIKNRYSDRTIFEGEFKNLKEAVKDASLEGANFRGANLYRANLYRANLKGANLENANFRGAGLEGANLKGANFRGAGLEGASLEGASLENANLKGASLEDANFEGANLEDANFEGANLRDANLAQSYGVSYAQCSFDKFGEGGRMLTCAKINEELVFFCGCFRGSEAELRKYIQDGEEKYRETREFALKFLIKAMSFPERA